MSEAKPKFRVIDDRTHLSASAAEQILEAIRTGLYAPGDRLPPERALAEQMQISRNSVREAISALERSGVLEARVGSGTYVKEFSLRSIALSESLERVDIGFDAMEIWEARCELDISLIKLAADRATSRDYDPLQSICKSMCSAADDGDVERILDLNRQFCIIAAKASGNIPLQAARSFLHRLTERDFLQGVEIKALQDEPHASVTAHANMLLAMRLRDIEACARAVHEYYNILRKYLAEKL
jgi:GntR family transcriptional regulator, transcriptional repressor for pyruvate dehydrogenase complex